jgi:hypothetical protein
MMVYTQDIETPVVPIPPTIAALVEEDENAWKKEKVRTGRRAKNVPYISSNLTQHFFRPPEQMSFDIKKKLVNVIIVDSDHKTISGFPKLLMQTQKAGPLIDYIAKTNYPELVDDYKFRLRRDSQGVEGETFNGREGETLVSLGTHEYSRNGKTVRFMIEKILKTEEWEDRKPDDIKLTCIVIDPRKVKREIENPSEKGISYLRDKKMWIEEGDEKQGLSLLTDFYIGAASTVGELKEKVRLR